jgi:hypothetical protein
MRRSQQPVLEARYAAPEIASTQRASRESQPHAINCAVFVLTSTFAFRLSMSEPPVSFEHRASSAIYLEFFGVLPYGLLR